MSRYDAIVVGARVAGSGMAAFLSRAGFRVLLIDRAHFPKPTLSCPFFFANTLDMIRRIGALPRIDAIGAPPLKYYLVHMEDILLRGRMLPYNGIDHAYSIQRELFDAAFFEHVAALPNVETRLGFNLTGLLWDEAHTRVIGIKGSAGGGAEEEVQADLVVGADGIFSTVARQVEAQRYNVKAPYTCVYYAYYSNVKASGGEPTATLYRSRDIPSMFVTGNSDHNLTVISLSLPASQFEQARTEVDKLHAKYAAHFPDLADRMSGAVRETPMYGVSPRKSFYRVPFGPGWVLVGDAGYFKDPITGQGLHDGLRAAELAAGAYAGYRSGADWTLAMRQFQATRDRETRPLYDLTDFYAEIDRVLSPQELDLFRALSEMPHWADQYVSLFNGVTNVKPFVSTPNLVRIVWEWKARQAWQKLTGKKVLYPAGA